MVEYNLEILKKCANNLMFDMSEDQYLMLLEEFDILTKQMDVLKEIEGLNQIEPMTFPFDVYVDYLREDIPEEGLSQEDILKNAKEVEDNQIKLPKVVG